MTGKKSAVKPSLKYNLVRILERALIVLASEANFAVNELSLDQNDEGVSVWSDRAVKCDALGWILKAAYSDADIAAKPAGQRRAAAYKVSELINTEVLKLTGCRTLVTISTDDGREAVVKILTEVREILLAQRGDR